MLDMIGSFGSGIGTNLLSDSLSKKLEAFKDKKAIASFIQSLRDWEIEFENRRRHYHYKRRILFACEVS